jgi:tRNA A-37 threonylcarbamoyl transferase component Bud32
LADGQHLLGRYEIKRFIARGGMGEVYEAFDSVLGERVALKTLLATSLDDERAIARLADEVRLARKVTHVNVCRILEFGVYHPAGRTDAAIPFLTMEFLTGEALSRRVAARGRLAPSALVKMLTDLTAGLAAIHAAGIVHRDFKSENVLLVPDDVGGERAVIMDFGLARGLGDNRRRASSTAAAGTPDYMAPEQVEGRQPTPAFDIYALGVVIFELLTGQKPFSGTSPYMAALSRLRERAPAPSTLVPGLAPVWDTVVGRCLERQPERRFGRVEEIAVALQDAAEGGSAPGRRRWRVAVAATGVLALVAAGGVWLMRTERPASMPATAPLAVPANPPAAPDPKPNFRSPFRAPLRASFRSRRTRSPPRRSARALPGRAVTSRSRTHRPAPRRCCARAEAHMLVGEVERGCELGERAAAAMPTLPAAQRFLGQCYIRLGDSTRAHPHYRRYLELAPDAPDREFVRAILERSR